MAEQAPEDHYRMLTSFLEQDGENPSLLRDAAIAALEADLAAEAFALFDRLEAGRPLEAGETNQRAIAAMRSGRPQLAAQMFEELRLTGPDDPSLSFNHAWALALNGRDDEAKEALSEEAISILPQAAMLQLQLAHRAGDFDEAERLARQHAVTFPDYAPLMATISILAMDIDDQEFARQCAEAAGDHPDAMTTAGLLALGEGKPAEAADLFRRAIELQPSSPRALIGAGLASLASGDPAEAGEMIDKGAEIFGDHLGSWIAAGWSYLLAGDRGTARARFEQALALDSTFAETHGSLAVMDILDCDVDGAKRKCETALRLDRQCFSASFAKVLLSVGEGEQQQAEKILSLALRQPLGASGRTLADAIAKLAT